MPAATETQSESAITIYAELLSFIGQISVTASLATATNSETRAEIVDNGSVIHFHHDGCTKSMKLPAPVAQSASLPLPQSASQQVSWRLPTATKASRSSAISLENQALPWNAVDIKPATSVKCRSCTSTIVKNGTIGVWKDLPSENWAEMMEFWHCHKPHDHEEHPDEEHLANRGYGASNAISAQSSVGFVDITSFVFAEEDCNGLLVSQPQTIPDAITGRKKLARHSMAWSSIQLPKINDCRSHLRMGGLVLVVNPSLRMGSRGWRSRRLPPLFHLDGLRSRLREKLRGTYTYTS